MPTVARLASSARRALRPIPCLEGRLIGVNLPDGASVSHRYDGDGQKLYTLDTVIETYFLLDRGQVIADVDGAGAIIAAYFRVPGGRVVTTHQRTGTYHYHLAGLGSVVGLTKSDGDWDTQYRYDEYGIVQAERGIAWNNFQYTAAMYSQSSGLYHLGAPHYNPAIGRFITQDTYRGSVWQPWTQHLYAHVGNNPMNYVDPSGHVPMWDGGGPALGKSCEEYGLSGDTNAFLNVCVGNASGRYAAVQVTTFVPDAIFYDLGLAGYGDDRDLFQSGTHRTQQTVLLDTVEGAVLSNVPDTSPSHIRFRSMSFPAPQASSLKASSGLLADGSTVVNVNAHSASRGLAWAGLDISYSFNVHLPAGGGAPQVYGAHDGFPGYELFIYTATGQAYGLGYHSRENWQTTYSMGSDGTVP